MKWPSVIYSDFLIGCNGRSKFFLIWLPTLSMCPGCVLDVLYEVARHGEPQLSLFFFVHAGPREDILVLIPLLTQALRGLVNRDGRTIV
jgi:hypothetical protein